MNVDILFLNNKDMQALGAEDMQAVLNDVEQAYMLTEKGDVLTPGKCVMRWGETIEDENKLGRINAMPGYIGGEYDMAGIKWIGSGPSNYKKGLPRASVILVLNDPETKLPVCLADGTQISAMRTGASGGVAVKLLARQDAEVMAVCGAGAQGRTQLDAAVIVRPSIRKVNVYDISAENAQRYVDEMSAKYPAIEFTIAPTAEAACRGSDIIVTVTLASVPFVEADWLKKGSLLMNLAGNEVSYGCIEAADKIVVDNWDTIKHRMASTIALMADEGLIKDEDIDAQLGQILDGKKTGRDNDEQIIFFNAVGTGILDLAVATRCYRKALKENVGIKIPYWR